ncbi:DUF4401 domain-containing protein [Chryseobacterium sp. G0186]|uniref:DUF4401 domain-containing protein n=1 Tax=Chryseobacterium sp. G0186 TaxID=2487064 RepID=UPI000F50CB3F|nr:DUF4401 domain-containing protein [Chryseobacterium sp. G0186]AZA78032.1 DUF4401 domain-containing protein [Chryseobacterium sp. G0186]
MRNKENIQTLLQDLRSASDKEIHFDEEAIIAAYEEKNTNHQSLAIKILSIFGGIMACLAFLGFIFLAQIFDSQAGLIILGIICIAGSSYFSRLSKKTITDTLSVSFFITGFALLGFGLSQKGDIIYLIFIVLALCALFLAQSYILSFISVLIINGAIIAFAADNNMHSLPYIIIALQALATTFLFLQEAKIITKNRTFATLYDPVRTGMVFSFLFTLAFLSLENLVAISVFYNYISSAVIIIAILYVVTLLFKTLHVTNTMHKAIMYVLTIALLLPTLLTPSISGAILIILLSFLVNYRTGFVLGIIALIYFIGKFYYDLHFTLLTKSILLFVSGIIFLVIYFFTHKKLTANEKI